MRFNPDPRTGATHAHAHAHAHAYRHRHRHRHRHAEAHWHRAMQASTAVYVLLAVDGGGAAPVHARVCAAEATQLALERCKAPEPFVATVRLATRNGTQVQNSAQGTVEKGEQQQRTHTHTRAQIHTHTHVRKYTRTHTCANTHAHTLRADVRGHALRSQCGR